MTKCSAWRPMTPPNPGCPLGVLSAPAQSGRNLPGFCAGGARKRLHSALGSTGREMGGMRLLALALVLGGAIPDESLPGTQEQRPLQHFLYQERGECHFQNGTQRVRLLVRSFWDQQEIFNFDSDLGRYVALAELGRPVVDLWNGNQDILRNNQDDMERFCRGSYTEYMPSIASTRVRPIVTVTPTDHDTAPHNILLVCNVGAFFPPSIEIKWFRNGEEANGSQVWSTDLIRNGDWSFQTEVMLETRPEKGDVYACWVDHASFEEPVMVQWEAQSDAARSKIWTGAVGMVLGLVFWATGQTLYLCRKKGVMK